MALTNNAQDAVIAAILQGIDISWRTTTPLYVSLHTASPGAGGNQATSEAAYSGYARQSIAHTTAGFDLTAHVGSNIPAITFPLCSGGSETITYVGIGTASSGTGALLMYFALPTSIAVSAGIRPAIAAGAFTLTVA